ncbi:uncharacterized protein [Miscanthus floridulus]|uniref:uncharacterized protein n=1 Tax=Miscanthus floridulus TaxID=154761 RepID=UPI0034593D6F
MKHFHVDYVNFLVANFNMAYHAILGRPALAKFMAVPHYTYLVLKMLAEQGVLSLCANHDIAYNHKKESFTLAEARDISIYMQDYIVTSQVIPLEDLEIPTLDVTRASTKSKEFKEVVLILDNQSNTTWIGADLDPK